MRVAVLTSSRADFGIYLPLLKALNSNSSFELSIIAFGTHLSVQHGYTLAQIKEHGFENIYTVESMVLGDTPECIATAMGLTQIKFATFWHGHAANFDLILCLGDRYEMHAAVYAAIPFNLVFAHFHGGETTEGAIDNIFRHAITLASRYHFVATQTFADKVSAIKGSAEGVYHVGSMSLQNLTDLPLLTVAEFKEKWNVDLSFPTILVTLHPETVGVEMNSHYAHVISSVIRKQTRFRVLLTMPNADTAGNTVRNIFINELSDLKHVRMIENLGSQSYFTAMKYCSFLLGNTSSGIIEAASFGKYVINLGDRQKGRAHSDNIFNTGFDEDQIQAAIQEIEKDDVFKGENIYYKEDSVDSVIEILKGIHTNE